MTNIETSSGISRRTMAKGAAWAVPAVAMASAAPRIAASPPVQGEGVLIAVPWGEHVGSPAIEDGNWVLANTSGNIETKPGYAYDKLYLTFVMFPTQMAPGGIGTGIHDMGPDSTRADSGDSQNRGGTKFEWLDACGLDGYSIIGEKVTITVEVTDGSNTFCPTRRHADEYYSSDPDKNPWPMLIWRDRSYYDITNPAWQDKQSGAQITTSAQYFGEVKSTDLYKWQWELTMKQAMCTADSGADAVTFDIMMPHYHNLKAGETKPKYKITIVSSWGTVTWSS